MHTPTDPASAHDLHEPVQAVEQQTPCAQNPDRHSLPLEQANPGGPWPHVLLTQLLPAEQFASVVHAEKQREPLHAKGAHMFDEGATHCRAATQVEGGV